jgi:bacterioferritin-associated ferredoxin
MFSEMKKTADEHKTKNVEELRKFVTFGINCKLCLPYVEKMLQTGKTEFEPIQL